MGVSANAQTRRVDVNKKTRVYTTVNGEALREVVVEFLRSGAASRQGPLVTLARTMGDNMPFANIAPAAAV